MSKLVLFTSLVIAVRRFCWYPQTTVNSYIFRMEVAEVHQSKKGFISGIPLLLGIILLLGMGLGLISSHYVLVVVLVCFIFSVLFIERVLKKLFDDIL